MQILPRRCPSWAFAWRENKRSRQRSRWPAGFTAAYQRLRIRIGMESFEPSNVLDDVLKVGDVIVRANLSQNPQEIQDVLKQTNEARLLVVARLA